MNICVYHENNKEERRKDNNPMKRNKIVYSFLILAVILVFAVGPKVASAIPIYGVITMGGVIVTPIDSRGSAVADYSTATGLDFGGAIVTSATGSFDAAGIIPFGTLATYSDFQFGSMPVASLWTAGPASFDLTSINILQQDPDFMDLRGSGIVSITGFGFVPTPATWTFTGDADLTHGVFSFTTITSTPEPGTVILLGIGLAGLVGVGVRRRMKTRKQAG